MLYSGIHYVSPSGDFCLKLRVLNFQKFEKKIIKMKAMNQNSETKIEIFNRFWKQGKKLTLKTPQNVWFSLKSHQMYQGDRGFDRIFSQ